MSILKSKKNVLLVGIIISSICACKAEKMPDTKIYSPWIAVVSIDSANCNKDSMTQRMRRISNFIARAALDKPDLVLLPEACLSGLGKLRDPESFIKRDDQYFNAFKKLAKKYRCHIAAAILFEMEGKKRNSVLVFDPAGKHIYTYHKSFLTPSELNAGLIPGAVTQKCWNAPWGKTAFAICFDLNFPELFENYKKQHAQLLLFPSYFPGGMVLKQRAFSLRAYAISSHGQGFESVFIDRVGREFARTNMLEPVITRKIELNSAVIRFDPAKFKKVKSDYGRNVLVESCRPEGFSVIAVPELKIDVRNLMNKYGLVDIDDWYLACKKANEQKR